MPPNRILVACIQSPIAGAEVVTAGELGDSSVDQDPEVKTRPLGPGWTVALSLMI